MLKPYKYIFLFIGLFLVANAVDAQITRIMGVVLDKATNEPIPFASVLFKNTTHGVSADFDGAFSLDYETDSDTLIASALGYHEQRIPIKKGVFQRVTFRLKATEFNLNEVEVFAEVDPAIIIFNKTIANKEKNNPKEFDAIDYRLYNKVEVDANNVAERFKKNRFLKKFQLVFNYIDTSTINGKAYLPVFISESVSRVYKKSNPKVMREIIEASQISGMDNSSLSQFMGGLYQEVNVYDNFIEIFQKNFVSPLSDNGRNTYDYVLIDTVNLNNRQNFHLMFKPKRKQELTFVGELWIHDSTFAVTRVDMKAAVDANINFVNDIDLSLEYDFVNHKNWVLSKDKITLDLNVVENTEKVPGFFATRTSYYSDFHFDDTKNDSVFLNPVNVRVLPLATNKKPDYWNSNRDVPLNKNERGIYQMVDSVQKMPVFKSYIDAVYMFTSGYLIWNKVEIGPTFKAISSNTTEGLRFRLGGRTSNKFSTTLMLEGFLAYGLKDKQLKGSAGFAYMFNKNPYRKLSGNYTYDLEQLGQSHVVLSNDNFLTSLLRRSPNDKQSLVEELKLKYEHEWFSGFSSTVTFINRKMFPVGNLDFKIWDEGSYQSIKSLKTTELGFSLRLAIQEKYLMGEFVRINLGTRYPVLRLDAFYGLPHFFEYNQEYFRLNFQLQHWFNIGGLGWSSYAIEAGKIWGTVPYPLLPIAPGNQTLIFDPYVFNLMNYYEFINDEYISAFYTHHFDGLLFNRLPLLRKLNWREVITAKAIVGNLSEKNALYSVFPSYSKALTRPYYEVGVGVENIFKIVRIDFVWRLNHLSNPKTQKFGILGSLQFSF
jgi:hypothetical protein